MSIADMKGLTLWEYTAVVHEHNSRHEDAEAELEPWTPEEYQREIEALRARGDPSIKV